MYAQVDELIGSEAQAAREAMIAALGFDPVMTPAFWEAWVAQHVGGCTTPHKAPHDVEAIGLRQFRFEVKFSRAFQCAYTSGPRRVFKWALTKPQVAAIRQPDAVVLIGVDGDKVWTWACPGGVCSTSMTVVTPDTRRGGRRGARMDAMMAPPHDLLPAILRAAKQED